MSVFLLFLVFLLSIGTDPPSFSNLPFSLSVVESNPFILDVQVDANPFLLNFSVITPSDSRQDLVVAQNPSASIVTVVFPMFDRYSAGMYTVTASNLVGSGSNQFEIDVVCE